jgi:hypothetical protein
MLICASSRPSFTLFRGKVSDWYLEHVCASCTWCGSLYSKTSLTRTSGDRPKTSVLTELRVIRKLKESRTSGQVKKIGPRKPRVCVIRVRVNEVLLYVLAKIIKGFYMARPVWWWLQQKSAGWCVQCSDISLTIVSTCLPYKQVRPKVCVLYLYITWLRFYNTSVYKHIANQ